MLGSSTEKSCAIKSLKVRSINGTAIIDLARAYNQQNLPVDQNKITTKERLKQWPHLYEIGDEIPEFDADVPIGLLIGVNCTVTFRLIKVVKETNNGPFTQKTVLGWCIIGPMSNYNLSNKVVRCNRIAVVNKAEGHIASHHFVVENSVKETACKQMLLDMYEQEFSEPSPKKMRKMMKPVNANGYISSSKDIALSKENDKFLGKMEKGVTKMDGHYQLPLPFRHENVKLPDSRHQAVQCAVSMRKRFKDQQFYDDYVKFMKIIIEKGYAKKVTLLHLKTEEAKVWYLPHHGIYHPKKPDKIRVVFDFSCQYEGRSLNPIQARGGL